MVLFYYNNVGRGSLDIGKVKGVLPDILYMLLNRSLLIKVSKIYTIIFITQEMCESLTIIVHSSYKRTLNNSLLNSHTCRYLDI